MEGFITEPNDIYLWNIVTYGAHRRHCLLFIICKYRSIFLCVTTGSVALLVYKPFVYFIISLSNKVLLFNTVQVRELDRDQSTRKGWYFLDSISTTVPFRSVRTVTGHRDFGLSEMLQMSQVTGRLAESTRIVVTNAKNVSF